jgi:hypothetical protein
MIDFKIRYDEGVSSARFGGSDFCHGVMMFRNKTLIEAGKPLIVEETWNK